MYRYLLIALVFAGCAAAPVGTPAPVGAPEKPAAPPPVSTTAYAGSFRITLSGEPMTAPPLTAERIGAVPFGKWLNAVPMKKSQYGYEFSVELVECSSAGCTVRMEDPLRTLIAKDRIAGAVRLDIYDKGWRLNGSAAISNGGEVAVPTVSAGGKGEIWVIRKNERMRKRIPHTIVGPALLKWHTDGLYLVYFDGGGLGAYRVDIPTGGLVSATPIEAWWTTCEGGPEQPLAVGMAGETPAEMSGVLALPAWRRGDPEPGWIVLTNSSRPMTANGAAVPVRVVVDCRGRINVVSALSDFVWCLRFGPDGGILNATRLEAHLAGDAKSVIIDEFGRFYYLEVEMDPETGEPRMMHFVRMR